MKELILQLLYTTLVSTAQAHLHLFADLPVLGQLSLSYGKGL